MQAQLPQFPTRMNKRVNPFELIIAISIKATRSLVSKQRGKLLFNPPSTFLLSRTRARKTARSVAFLFLYLEGFSLLDSKTEASFYYNKVTVRGRRKTANSGRHFETRAENVCGLYIGHVMLRAVAVTSPLSTVSGT